MIFVEPEPSNEVRNTIDLKAAAARSAALEPMRDLTFEKLCGAYIPVKFDGVDLRIRKWIEAFGTLERDMLERCIEAMTGAASRGHRRSRAAGQ